jgi:hypothetical protein
MAIFHRFGFLFNQLFMKRYVFVFLFLSFAGYAQVQFQTGSSGSVYDTNGYKYEPKWVRAQMKDHPEALKLYNVGRQKKTFGNVMFYTGIGLGLINLYQGTYGDNTYIDSNGYPMTKKVGPELAIIGGVLVLASIPVKLGYSKKIQQSIEEYNKGIAQASESTVSMSIQATTNGLGVLVRF